MKVSLYIPCFNAEKTIKDCLDSVLKQDYPIKKIFVIDDGSSDKTVEIASKYPVKIIKHKTNKGLAAARNTAVKNIHTEFIASLDADCIPKADWLLRLMHKFRSTRIVGAGGRLLEDHVSTIFDRWRSVHMKQDWGDKQVSPDFLFGSNSVFLRRALLEAGLYNEEFRSNYEDVDISKRLKRNRGILVYEPQAIAYHRKRDDIYSILNAYWRWNLAYYRKRGFYSNLERFIFKVKDNIGLANRYMEEEIISKRYHLIYLDFLLVFHHTFRDFEYFICQNRKQNLGRPLLSCWISLIDLTFFYHFGHSKKKMQTFMPKDNSLLQNFFAMNLILGKIIKDKFKDPDFEEIVYKHLFLSVYRIEDEFLLDKLLNLIRLHPDWNSLISRQHSNLNAKFLKKLSLTFDKWLDGLIYKFPDMPRMIEASAKNTEMDCKRGGV